MKAKPGFILPFVMFILLACNPGKTRHADASIYFRNIKIKQL